MRKNGNIMEENLLVNEFFQKLTERNGKSIAANSNYNSNEVMLKLAKKYNITAKYAGQANTPARDHIWVYEVNGQLYGLGFSSYHQPDPNPKYDKTDWLKLEYVGYRHAGSVPSWHPAGPDEWGSAQVYKILGKVSADDVDENVWNFLQDFGWYRESKESNDYQGKNSPYNKKNTDAAKEEYKKAKSIINIEILRGEFPQPEDFADDFYENSDRDGWSNDTSREGIDTEFEIKVLLGHTPLYTGIVHPDLSYEECLSSIEYSHIVGEIDSIWDDNDNEIPLVELADKIPESRFRDLYVKYISKVVTEAVDAYVKKNSVGYEIDWSAFEPDY